MVFRALIFFFFFCGMKEHLDANNVFHYYCNFSESAVLHVSYLIVTMFKVLSRQLGATLTILQLETL